MRWHRRPQVIAAEPFKLRSSNSGSRELAAAKSVIATHGTAAKAAEMPAAEMSSPETAAIETASVALSGRAKDERADCETTGRDYGERPDHFLPPQTRWMQR